MAWPTSRTGEAPGVALPVRTTLTDLRSRPVTELPGVGPRIESALGDLGIASLADMIDHLVVRILDQFGISAPAARRWAGLPPDRGDAPPTP